MQLERKKPHISSTSCHDGKKGPQRFATTKNMKLIGPIMKSEFTCPTKSGATGGEALEHDTHTIH
jgi:hypothetical protein